MRAGFLNSDFRTGPALLVYGLGHFVVDTLSAGILFTLWMRTDLSGPELGAYFLLHNLLAFVTQPVLGLVVDRSRRPRAAALLGCAVMAVAAVVFSRWPLPGIVAAGLGNALFHVGAGSICLQLTPGRATAPGLFVAPGALGLFLGTCLGQTGSLVAWPLILVLAALGVIMTRIPLPAAGAVPPVAAPQWKWIGVALVLLLGCISVRSLVGFSVAMPWKPVFAWSLAAVVAVSLGKALGGVLADRLGWGRVAVGALVLSSTWLAFGSHSPFVAIAGLLLFNFTMPVTLAATANLLPGRPALAFGLTALVLELGAWVVIPPHGNAAVFGHPWVVFGLILAAAVALYLALRTAFGRVPALFTGVHE